jgi:hypothetical protein
MTPAELDRLCAEARVRLQVFVARSAAQHWRRWREAWLSDQGEKQAK